MLIQGMSMAGFHEEARIILEKVLSKAIGPDGCAIESSRWSGYDLTELDQNGQILYAAWIYLCWTGDLALIKKYWNKIVLAGDFPLLKVFRDEKSGLLRNKREFWERDDRLGVEDGYELVYQFWVVYGLEKGAEVARRVGDTVTAVRWEKEAAGLKETMLNDPTFRFIEEGHLIKRRTRDGRWQRYYIPANRNASPAGSPLATIEKPEGDPDTGTLYPIIYGMLDPRGDVAKATIAYMDILWNQRWDFGGYARYNTDSEPDPPGPWPIASLFVARAALEAGDHERVWRSLKWIEGVHGGKAGGWFERYGPSITPPAPPVCVVGWAWAEIELLFVHHMFGFRPDLEGILVRPKLPSGVDNLASRFTIRGGMVDVEIRRGTEVAAMVNGKSCDVKVGGVRLPFPRKGALSHVQITVV
jgi:GH15 family glucan-1,4-alpha-glucosidase